MPSILHNFLLLLTVASWPAFASPEDEKRWHPVVARAADPKEAPTTTRSAGDIVFVFGSTTLTAEPTGFKVGSTMLTPGGHVQVGTETLSLKTGGGAVILDGTTVPFSKKPQTLTAESTETTHTKNSPTTKNPPTTSKHAPTTKSTAPASPKPSNTGDIVVKVGTTVVTAKPTGAQVGSSRLTPGGDVKVGSETLSLKQDGKAIVLDGKTVPFASTPQIITGGHTSTVQTSKPAPTTSKHAPSTTKDTPKNASTTKHTPTTKDTSTAKHTSGASHTKDTSTTKHTSTSKDTSPPKDTTTKHTPGASHTKPKPSETGDNEPTSSKHTTSHGGTSAPITTAKTSSQDWTTLSDSSTTGLYGVVTLPKYRSLTEPTTITTSYIVNKTKTTTGPIYVGTGGVVLQSWPPSSDDDHSGHNGALIIPDPIRPPSDSKLKCPSLLKWLCGSSHTSSSDNGPDVDPIAKPNSDPKDDPNKEDKHTTDDNTKTSTESETSKESTSTKTSSASTCTNTQTVTDCQVKCSPTVVSSTTKTTCYTTSCSKAEACSTTGATSTTYLTASRSSTRTANGTEPTVWIHPYEELDKKEVDKLAKSIQSEDASILKEFSALLAETESSTFATATSRPNTRTSITSHTAPMTTATRTENTKTKTHSEPSSTTSQLKCYNQYNSDKDQDTCYCEGHDGNRVTMSSSSGMKNYQPCAWTTLPPLYTDKNVGPITSTLDGGDIVYCSSAHWASDGGSSKYCIGSVSTISAATTSTSTTSSGAEPTGKGDPTGEMYFGIVAEGYSFTWNVYTPKVGDIPDWCDDSSGSMEASGDTTRYWLPPDIKFSDLDGDAKKYKCQYKGDKDHAGTLTCDGMGEIPCTSDFKQSKDDPMCTGSIVYAGSAFPRIYCKWYGGTFKT